MRWFGRDLVGKVALKMSVFLVSSCNHGSQCFENIMKGKEISIGVQKCCKISFKDGTVRFYTFIVSKGGGGGAISKNVKYTFLYISILLFVFTGVTVIV